MPCPSFHLTNSRPMRLYHPEPSMWGIKTKMAIIGLVLISATDGSIDVPESKVSEFLKSYPDFSKQSVADQLVASPKPAEKSEEKEEKTPELFPDVKELEIEQLYMLRSFLKHKWEEANNEIAEREESEPEPFFAATPSGADPDPEPEDTDPPMTEEEVAAAILAGEQKADGQESGEQEESADDDSEVDETHPTSTTDANEPKKPEPEVPATAPETPAKQPAKKGLKDKLAGAFPPAQTT